MTTMRAAQRTHVRLPARDSKRDTITEISERYHTYSDAAHTITATSVVDSGWSARFELARRVDNASHHSTGKPTLVAVSKYGANPMQSKGWHSLKRRAPSSVIKARIQAEW
jgi:hypothetical protein